MGKREKGRKLFAYLDPPKDEGYVEFEENCGK